jgi:hypothetical protein
MNSNQTFFINNINNNRIQYTYRIIISIYENNQLYSINISYFKL